MMHHTVPETSQKNAENHEVVDKLDFHFDSSAKLTVKAFAFSQRHSEEPCRRGG